MDTDAKRELLRIWVDADSCPREVRRVLLRAASRLNAASMDLIAGEQEEMVPFHFVASQEQPIRSDPRQRVYFHRVACATDAADQFIHRRCRPGDMVITRDIVFAEQLCLQQPDLRIINDRGTEFSRDNVSARRLRRDLALKLRGDDLLPSHGHGYGAKELQQFAACFDRCLNQQIQRQRRKKNGNTCHRREDGQRTTHIPHLGRR